MPSSTYSAPDPVRSGIIEEDIIGIIAAAFTHWDSRAGDPQLHDHVIVWNRARSVSDGRWRTLDSRGLFKATVMLSELHQGVLSDLLTQRLGVGWERRDRRHSEHRRYEITGVPEKLMQEFSQRAGQVETHSAELIRRFVSAHGRQPTTVDMMQLRQRATLETRPNKQHRSLANMTLDWRGRAERYLGREPEQLAWVAGLADRNDLPLLHSSDLEDAILADAARVAKDAVSSRRATFTRHNVTAEALRLLHGVRFASPDERVATVERIVTLALDGSLLLNPPSPTATPDFYLRADGTSRLHPESHHIYTTQEILDAEVRLLEAGRRVDGPTVSRDVVARITDQSLTGGGERLSLDQALAVEKVATSGRALDVLIGPAGTGKSTTMASLRAIWEAQHGDGSVIGLAPSAAAAEVLADELGIDTENTAKWLTEWRRVPDLVAQRQRLASTLAAHGNTGITAVHRLRTTIEDLDTQIKARKPCPGQLIIVDEASLAGTFTLDELASAANSAGAKALLVGDPAQLSAVEAGGAFGLLAKDQGDLAPQLNQVRRFTNEWERHASLDLRRGKQEALDAYEAHGRLVGGDRHQLLESLYLAWKTDTDAGRTSLMIAPDTATVAELNSRARAERVTAGAVNPEGVKIADGQIAGVGDAVITRQNDRRLSTGGRWIKNGDRWTVSAIYDDGHITATRSDGNGDITLPAAYVAQHVELAYASTAYQVQGRTVDTAHAFVSPTTTREVLYVSATRGRQRNRLYIDTHFDPDPGPVMPEPRGNNPPTEVLAAVLSNEGAETSADETLQRIRNDAYTLLAGR